MMELSFAEVLVIAWGTAIIFAMLGVYVGVIFGVGVASTNDGE